MSCIREVVKTRASRTTGAKGNNLFASTSKLQILSMRCQVTVIKVELMYSRDSGRQKGIL